MKTQQFLSHYGIKENPFGQEDAQTDQIFKQHCLDGTHHPAWDKVYGSPEEPSTAVVFGEKGSGKTALRLQVVEHLKQFNRTHLDKRVYVVEYDDFNPFLDCFRERLRGWRRRPERALQSWRLWDHMDAILTLGVTRLVDSILGEGHDVHEQASAVKPEQMDKLTQLQRRDLLLLAAFYDHSLSMNSRQRWSALRKKLKFSTWRSEFDRAAGIGISVLMCVLWAVFGKFWPYEEWWVFKWWFWGVLAVGWAPWLWRQARLFWTSWRVSRQVRVIDHQPNMLRQVLSRFQRGELAGQPVPSRDRSDDRYEMLNKLRSVLRTLGFQGIMVVVDRVDEPHLVNGSAERMRDLLWPMFDNKFLKQPGIGFKLLLPSEVNQYLNREGKEFYERSRLDKQNLIPSLEWTGESLYDVANARIQACVAGGDGTGVGRGQWAEGSESRAGGDGADGNNTGAHDKGAHDKGAHDKGAHDKGANGKPVLKDLFDDSISDGELVSNLSRLRVPRHLFKFMYRLLINHCNKYTEENPRWKIERETLHSTMALYQRDLEAFDRGLGTG